MMDVEKGALRFRDFKKIDVLFSSNSHHPLLLYGINH